MKTVTYIRSAVAALATGFCVNAFAHDASTLAFYPFTDQPAGMDFAEAGTATNAVSANYTGTMTLGTGHVAFDADVPGQYVFDSDAYGAVPLAEHPQSLRFYASRTDTKTAEALAFDSLGTALSQGDDFTIEFFFKVNSTEYGPDYNVFLNANCGLIYNQDGAARSFQIGPTQGYKIFHNCVYSMTYHSALLTAGATYDGSKFADGYWHHYAVVYTKSSKTYTVYCDYGNVSVTSKTTDKTALSEALPVTIGMGGFKGWMSCFRFSSCARTTSQFLRCSNAPTYLPKTVFHFSLDGLNGTDITTVTNVDSTAIGSPFAGQYVGRSDLANATATAVTWKDSESNVISPAFTNEIFKSRKTAVMAEGRQICNSTNSARFIAKPWTDEEYAVAGSGLNVKKGDCRLVSSGSFTMEAWLKLDWDSWKAKVGSHYKSAMRRSSIFGLNYSGSVAEFVLWFYAPSLKDLQLKLTMPNSVKSDPYCLAPALEDGGWHHVAVVYDDSITNAYVYLDGKVALDVPLTQRFVPHTYGSTDAQYYKFGQGLNNSGFEGLMDELRLVRGVLKPSEFVSFRHPPAGMMMIVK